MGRHSRDWLDRTGRVCRQTRSRSWPLVGITAELQRTVFVDRTRRHQTGDAVAEIVKRIEGGVSVVLFAEGTSSDGNRVLPFRSALLGAVEEAASSGSDNIVIQPMSICYVGQHGMPMGRQHRPLVAWYGDLDFMPHIKAFIGQGAVDALVTYGDPLPADFAVDRKTMTKQLEVRGTPTTGSCVARKAVCRKPRELDGFISGPGSNKS